MKQAPYDFAASEQEIQAYWATNKVFSVQENSHKPKRYILDMFPYPSGAGLHVGHLLGYFGSDVLAIHARMQGYAVLHPMGFDAFGLPAEQYAIDTGQRPTVTIKKNSTAYKKLLKATGISFTWEREIATTDEDYYRWTQWIFLQLFESWYNKTTDRAEPIATLRAHFEQRGNKTLSATCPADTPTFSAAAWQAFSPAAQEDILARYRLAYLSETMVNWCPALGTVLANDEVQSGVSERGGHPVLRKKMRQWSLRMTAYLDRLLAGLDPLDWSDDIKEIQRNWIGKSRGEEVRFTCTSLDTAIKIFTTRLDTLFGVSYLALAPEHPLVAQIVAWQKNTKDSKDTIFDYVATALNRSERDRLQNVEKISGVFTGLYAQHPLTQKKVPIWVADYVLPNYGTGAIMGVPAHDQRDYRFAKHFQLFILPVLAGGDLQKAAYEAKEGTMINSDFVNGLTVSEAQQALSARLETCSKSKKTIKYRMRDPIFSRQRYWGEPFPIYYKDGRPHALEEKDLPLKLPPIDTYAPSATGAPPLSRATKWHTQEGYPLEQNTMPAWAGSSWYFFRYMSPQCQKAPVNKKAADYWQAVDLYMGGKEHATGHLIYARFLTHFLYDRGHVPIKEPFTKLVNQGMIQSFSRFVYRIKGTNQFVSYGLKDTYETTPLRVDIQFVKKDLLDLVRFKAWRPHLAKATFILEEGQYRCGKTLEKMSKSKHNSVDPYPIIRQYGADALRLYMLFLGPIQQSKPWSTQGIEGIIRFMRKLWKLFQQKKEPSQAPAIAPSREELRILHSAIKQVQRSLANFSFNTAISALMICTNQLLKNKCRHTVILEDFLRLLAPLAPHMAEHLWQKQGYKQSIMHAGFPTYDPAYLTEDAIHYPVAINGKLRAKLTTSSATTQEMLKAQALAIDTIQKKLEGKEVKRVIVVPKRMINIVL